VLCSPHIPHPSISFLDNIEPFEVNNSRSESQYPDVYKKRAKAAPARPMPRPTGPAVASAAPPVELEEALEDPEAVEEEAPDVVKVLAAAVVPEAAADEDAALADAELAPLTLAELAAPVLTLAAGGTICEVTPAGRVATAGCEVTTWGCEVTTLGWPVTTPLELVWVRNRVAGLLCDWRSVSFSEATDITEGSKVRANLRRRPEMHWQFRWSGQLQRPQRQE
jgi:hypothetical protein